MVNSLNIARNLLRGSSRGEPAICEGNSGISGTLPSMRLSDRIRWSRCRMAGRPRGYQRPSPNASDLYDTATDDGAGCGAFIFFQAGMSIVFNNESGRFPLRHRTTMDIPAFRGNAMRIPARQRGDVTQISTTTGRISTQCLSPYVRIGSR